MAGIDMLSLAKGLKSTLDLVQAEVKRTTEIDAQCKANFTLLLAIIESHPDPKKLFEKFSGLIDSAGDGVSGASNETVETYRKPLQEIQSQILLAIKKLS